LSDKTDHPAVPEAFAALGVRPSILRGLADARFETPSEIQALLIPRALTGVDILGQARTGTGKTAAFGIPILQRAQKGLASQALILVPTRELAVQVEDEIKRLGQHTPIRSVAVYGGQKITAQMKFLKHGPEIIVGTPGRVIDLLERRIVTLDNIRFIVLDEVDRMLDIGFRDDIRNILSRVKNLHRNAQQDAPEETAGDGEEGADGPTRPQTIFVSATFSPEIEKLARQYMTEPVEKLVAPGADDKPTVEKVEQYYLSVQPWDKYRLLKMLLEKENPDLAIVFCRTKHGAQKLAKKLHADQIECREIHGNLAQNKRDRVMKGFRGGKFDVLVATDLASRGIDVADISHIINFDIPDDPEVYVHRVGRTARMGATGKAFTFVQRDQGDELTKVESLINMVIPLGVVEGFEPRPTPADWTDEKPLPGGNAPAAPPAPSRYERPYNPSGTAPSTPVTLPTPPRTLGSKIPITRRHRRRR
jgi:ATP-dependent RNA helicase DeaD